MIIGEIITRLGFKADTSGQAKYVDANKKAEKSAKGLSAASTAMATAVGSAVGQMATRVLASVAQLPRAFANAALEFANTGDEIAKTARKFGIGADELQRLRFVAARSGVSNEALQGSFRKLAIGIDQALVKGSGPAKAALDRLGVSVNELAGAGVEDQLGILADAFNKVEDPAERAALQVALLGRSGMEMQTLFEGGSQAIRDLGKRAEDLGGVLSDDALKGAEALNDGLYDVQYTMDALKNRVAAAAAPALAQLSDKFATAISENDQFIEQDLPNAIVAIADALVTLIPIMIDAVQGIAGMVKEIKDAATWFADEFPQATAIMGQAVEALADPWGSLATAVDWVITKVDELLGRTQAIRGFIDQVGVAAGIIDPSQENAISRARSQGLNRALGDNAPGAQAKIATVTGRRSAAELKSIANDENAPPSARAKASELLPQREAYEARQKAADEAIAKARGESASRLATAQRVAQAGARVGNRGGFSIDPETGEVITSGKGGGGRGRGGKGKAKGVELGASVDDLVNAAGEATIKGDAAREPLSGAQVVRIDATFSAPTSIAINIDGAKLPMSTDGAGREIGEAIGRALEDQYRRAYEHYRQAVRP